MLDEGDCTVGITPRTLEEGKVGDWYDVMTKDGKSYYVQIKNIGVDYIDLANETVRMTFATDIKQLEIYWREEDCSFHNSGLSPDMRNTQIVEMLNYPTDDESIHLCRLFGLHLHRLNTEQKMKLVRCFNEILGIKACNLVYGEGKIQ